MKAADDHTTRRKGTKAIPLRKHGIAVRGRCARRAKKPACCGLPGGGGHDTQTANVRRDGGSGTAGAGPAPEGGKRSEARGRRADRHPGGWGAGGPGLLRNQ